MSPHGPDVSGAAFLRPLPWLLWFSIIVLFVAALPLAADVLTMRDGTVVNGLVTYQDADIMLVRTETRVHKLFKRQIRNIRYGVSPYEARLEVNEAHGKERRLEREVALLRKSGASPADLETKRQELALVQQKRRRYAAVLEAHRREQARDRLIHEAREVTRKNEQLKEESGALKKELAAAESADRQQRDSARTYQGAITRTLVFPGWGRHYLGYSDRGWWTMGVFAAFFANYYLKRQDYIRVSASTSTDAAVAALALATRRLEVSYFYSEARAAEKSAAESLTTRALYMLMAVYVYGVYDILSLPGESPRSGPKAGRSVRLFPVVNAARESRYAGWRLDVSF